VHTWQLHLCLCSNGAAQRLCESYKTIEVP